MSFGVALQGLVIGSILVLATALAGAWALRRLGFSNSGAKRLVFGFAVGLAVLSHAVFFLLLAGILSGAVAWAILLGLAIITAFEAPRLAREIAPQARALRAKLGSTPDRILALVLVIAVLLPILQALAPPTSGDTVAYHFALPRLYAQEGGFVPLPNIEANGPLGQHMLYTLAYSLQGPQVAALVTVGQLGAPATGLALFGHERFSLRVGLVAAAVVVSAPPLMTVAGSGEVEAALGMFGFLAFWAALDWLRGAPRALPVIAIVAGAAAATKYYGLFLLVALFAAVGIEAIARRRAPIGRLLGVATFVGLGALVWASPHYLRNWVNTGNPVYPGAYSIFGGADWSPELDAVWRVWEETYKRPGGSGLFDLIAAPLRLGTDPIAFRAELVAWGPAILAFLPCVVLLARRDGFKDARTAIVYGGVFFALWFFTAFHMQRHLASIAGALGVAAMAGLEALGEGRVALRRIAALVIAGAIALNMVLAGIYHAEFAKPTLGIMGDEEYLNSQLRYQQDVEWMNANLPADAKVMHFTRNVNLYLERPYFQASLFDQGRIDWLNLDASAAVLAAARAEGVTHVFVDREALDAEAGTFPAIGDALEHQTTLVRALIGDYGTLVYEDERAVSARRTLDLGSVTVHPQVYVLG